ncbi:hypothetical protein DAPPUDRAFT_125907, partial [Daphnia pulex]
QHVRHALEQRGDQHRHHHQHRAQRRQAEAEQGTHAGGADDPAEAEQAVKARHHVFAAGPFDDHRLQVHCRIHRAKPGAKHEQRGDQRRNRRHRRQQRQCQTDQQGAASRHSAAAEARGENPRQRHRQNRTDPEAQQQQAERAFIEPGAGLGVWHQRRPRGNAEAGDEKGDARRHLLQASGDEGVLGVEAGHIVPWQKTSRPRRTLIQRRGSIAAVPGTCSRHPNLWSEPAHDSGGSVDIFSPTHRYRQQPHPCSGLRFTVDFFGCKEKK